MASLMIVTGPQAVGKMTVAEQIRDKTNFHLMVNHDSIEISNKIFGRGSDAQKKFNQLFREAAFKTAIENNVDLIFTFVTAFDLEEEIAYLNSLKDMFESTGGNFYFVELEADIETRLERNVTPHRLESKESKKDIEWTKNDILKTALKYQLNSDKQLFENHLKINNTNLEPDEVAEQVINKFNLERSQNDRSNSSVK